METHPDRASRGPDAPRAWRRTAVVASIAFALIGCGSLRIVRGTALPRAPESVAVLTFDGGDAALQAAAADGRVMGGLESGVRVVERQRVSSVVAERDASGATDTTPDYYRELGALLGADAFIAGSVSNGGSGRVVAVRLISAETGDVALAATYTSEAGTSDANVIGQRACAGLLAAARP